MTDNPTDGRPSLPPATTAEDPQLQVYMVHRDVIEAFYYWVDHMGWELKLIPRFGESGDDYIPTHMIVPKNLDALMRQRAAEYRAQMEVDGETDV